MTTAFVLGGGGVLGAAEVGMLRALFEVEVTPDLVLGTSVGALNGAMVARDPTPGGDRPAHRALAGRRDHARDLRPPVADGTPGGVERHAHLLPAPHAERLVEEFGETTSRSCRPFPGLRRQHRARRRALVRPPATGRRDHGQRRRPGAAAAGRVGDEHFLDGGIVNSIPLGRAMMLGADRGLRTPGRSHRPSAQAAEAAVGGRPRLVRDRPAPPLRPRAGRGAR